MDYAESRVYQAGDDVRRLDWRLTARSGKLHTKLFQEEREGSLLILLDTPCQHALRHAGALQVGAGRARCGLGRLVRGHVPANGSA